MSVKLLVQITKMISAFLFKWFLAFQEVVILFFLTNPWGEITATPWFFNAIYRFQCSGVFKAQSTTACQITDLFICYYWSAIWRHWSAADKQKKGFWVCSLAFFPSHMGLHTLSKEWSCVQYIFRHKQCIFINLDSAKSWTCKILFRYEKETIKRRWGVGFFFLIMQNFLSHF